MYCSDGIRLVAKIIIHEAPKPLLGANVKQVSYASDIQGSGKQQLSSPWRGTKALGRALRMFEKRPFVLIIIGIATQESKIRGAQNSG